MVFISLINKVVKLTMFSVAKLLNISKIIHYIKKPAFTQNTFMYMQSSWCEEKLRKINPKG